ncbi:MAG: Uma2 family endonuclease, partial [Polyangiaceae bacterium]
RETLIVADIAGWRAPHDRIVALPSPIGLVPEWVCEVLDPGTRTLDLTSKREAYALAGIKYLWILDPTARVLEAYENLRGRWLLSLAVSEDEIAASPFNELRFDVGDLWMPEPHPRPSHRPTA